MRFRCSNVACGLWPRSFEFEDNGGECPKCGLKGPPGIASLIDVHLVVMNPRGPIMGRMGRQLIACQPNRAYLCRFPSEPFAATDDPRAVTCPKCQRLPAFREVATQYDEMGEILGALGETPRVTVDLGENNADGTRRSR